MTPADRVVVIGAAGGVGAHMIQMAALFGARVAGFDVGEAKLAMIAELGADAVQSSDVGAVDPAVLWDEGCPTVVIDLVGTPVTLRWATSALDTGGRLVVLTTFPGQTSTFEPRTLVFGELTVLGSRYASVAEVRAAAGLVAAGRIRPVIGRTVADDSVLELHEALRQGQLVGRGALVWS